MSTILLYPLLDCPVQCEYCFADPHLPTKQKYNKELMVKTLNEIGKDKRDVIVLHGGEILSLPIKDLEYFLSAVKNLREETHIQTSLMGLTNEHIKLFKKYNTTLGISIDGPPELNILRGPRDPNKNKMYQKNIVKNIKRLRDENIPFGTIVVLTKCNAVSDKLETLIKWHKKNGFHGRFNPMFLPFWSDTLSKHQLTPEELKTVFLRLAEECLNDSNLHWNPIRECIDNLIGCGGLGCCSFSRCDYVTTAVKTIMPDGNLARCDRCFQDGYYYISDVPTTTRAEMLKQTECKDCKYFEICGGGCAGEGVGGDVRSKTSFCESYYGLYEFLEKKIRAMFPNVLLTIDVPNYFNDVYMQGKSINFVERFRYGSWKTPPNNQNTNQHLGHEDTNFGECRNVKQ